ncbi:MAG: peptidylprolyl isomerase [Gemmatimonadota bacterium]
MAARPIPARRRAMTRAVGGKRRCAGALASLALAALACLARPAPAQPGPGQQSPPQLLDRIVAVVDDGVILWSELSLRVRMELEQQGRGLYITPQELDQRLDATLDQMIDERVLVLKARADSVEVDAGQVEEVLNEQLEQVRGSMEPAEFASLLERSGLTERQLKSRYRKQIRSRLLYDRMTAQLAYKQFISRRDVDDYRHQYVDHLPDPVSISQISIKVQPRTDVVDAARQKIDELAGRLAAGEDFTEVARRYSEDPGSAAAGGNLGCFQEGFLVPEFETAALALRPGEVSQPVLTPFGYHLILLHERRERELCCSHILVRARTGTGDEGRALTELTELRQRALAGEDFAELARGYSQNPNTARSGGLWQVLPRDQIPSVLEPYLAPLGLGGISEPFVMEGFAHILRINDDQATLESLVRQQRLASYVQQLIDEFKLKIHVEKRLDEQYLWDPAEARRPAGSTDAAGAADST